MCGYGWSNNVYIYYWLTLTVLSGKCSQSLYHKHNLMALTWFFKDYVFSAVVYRLYTCYFSRYKCSHKMRLSSTGNCFIQLQYRGGIPGAAVKMKLESCTKSLHYVSWRKLWFHIPTQRHVKMMCLHLDNPLSFKCGGCPNHRLFLCRCPQWKQLSCLK